MATKTSLPTRYEIRTLGPEHSEWACALAAHNSTFASPLWSAFYTENLTARCYKMHEITKYLIDHQIESGLSLGVFDKEYQFKRPQSAALGGKLYWDTSDETAHPEKLLEQMDFPLLSLAMAYDSYNPFDREKLAPRIAMQLQSIIIHNCFAELDPRDPVSWQADGPGQVIVRNATMTKADETGKGLMGALARYMMRESAEAGFRGISIDCAHPSVAKVWNNPPRPFKAYEIARFNTFSYESTDKSGDQTYPLRPANVDLVRIYVNLKP